MTSTAPRWRRLLKPALGYVAATVLTTACFVLLHYIGNQTPFAVVAEKIAAEIEAEPVAWGTRREHAYNSWEYCYLTGAVLAGSAGSATPLYDAVFPRAMARDRGLAGDFCRELRRSSAAALAGVNATANAELDPRVPVRQWVGSKALYAIALRFLTVHEYHELIRKATYTAFAMLALAVALLGWRALAVATPLLIFGATLSGVEYLSDVAKGTPYAWAIFSAALVALLLRFPMVPASATRMFCFVAGMFAGYLWLFDGANFAAAVLIGLVAWLRYAPLAPRTRAARSAGCVFAHATGVALSICLCPVVRLGPASSWFGPGSSWFGAVAKNTGRIFAPEERDVLGKDPVTWAELVQLSVRETILLIDGTVVALGTALLVVGYLAWRRDWGAVKEALGIGVLALAPLVHFLLPNDMPYAAARLMYLPMALCWSVLATVLLRLPRPVYALAFVGLGGASFGIWLVWQNASTTALLTALDAAAADPRLRQIADDHFDVYLKDGRQLILHRDPCEELDLKRWFILDVYPRHSPDLPAERKAEDHVEITVHFIHQGLFTFGTLEQEGCALVLDLPRYPVAAIIARRYCCYEGEHHWHVSAPLDLERFRRAERLARATEPLARGPFDIHRVGDELIYLREPCAIEDVRGRFFLHVHPRQPSEADLGRFTNLDFDFLEHGVLADGRCVAERTLPYWDVDRAFTGQFVAGEGRMWATEFPIADATAPDPHFQPVSVSSALWRWSPTSAEVRRSPVPAGMAGDWTTFVGRLAIPAKDATAAGAAVSSIALRQDAPGAMLSINGGWLADPGTRAICIRAENGRDVGAAYAAYGRALTWEERRGGAFVTVNYGSGLVDPRWFDGDVSAAWLTDLLLYPDGRVSMNIAGADSLGNALAEPQLSRDARARLHMVIRRGEIMLVLPPIADEDATEPYQWQTGLRSQLAALGALTRADPSALVDVVLTPDPDNAFAGRAEIAVQVPATEPTAGALSWPLDATAFAKAAKTGATWGLCDVAIR